MNSTNIDIVGQGEVRIGQRTTIAAGVQIVFHRPATVTIGDYCTIGPGVKFIVDGGNVELGDWTTLHDRCLVLSGQGLRVGQHGWFGQHTVLDGTGGLTIGNGVRVGMYSQIWSHVAAGEQIEGCTLFGTRPVVIEDDVWLVGSCVVASGVTIGRRAVALITSNITKSVAAHSVVAGSPALPKDKLSFYKSVTPQEQWHMLGGWLAEAAHELDLTSVPTDAGLAFRLAGASRDSDPLIAFVREPQDAGPLLRAYPQATVCCLSNKRYVKRLSDVEQRVLKFLAGNKARFLHDTTGTLPAAA